MAKVRRCSRCGKRWRGQDGWNADMIAGLEAGHLCPDCQTTGEDLEAELNLILHPPTGEPVDWSDPKTAAERIIRGLANTYPTPEVMRDKANQLARARKDEQALLMVGWMRGLADDMENGTLWETNANADGRFAHCMRCGKDAPTTVDEFTKWSVATANAEQVGVICPDCRPNPV